MDASELKNLIVQENRTQELLESIGCKKVKLDGDFFRCTRPDGDNPMACAVNKNTLAVTIFTPHDGAGDIFNLISATYHCDFVESIRKILEILNIPDVNSAPKITKKKNPADCLLKYKSREFTEKDMKYYGAEILSNYIQLPNLMWVREGITTNTQIKYEIGYDPNTNRITIPHFSLDPMRGKYLGIKGRTMYKDYDLWGIKKYCYIVEFPKTQTVYGYIQNYLEIEKAGYCVVFESEKSVLKRDSAGDFTALAIMGNDISLYQTKVILSLNVDIVIALDEGISLEHIQNQCRKFSRYRNVYYIYDTEKILGEKESPADLSDEKYKYLLNKKEKFEE